MSPTPLDTDGPKRTRRGGRKLQNGAAIISFREKDGYSQNKFAQRLGMSQANLSRIEAELTCARVETLNAIAQALGVPVAAILRDSEMAA